MLNTLESKALSACGLASARPFSFLATASLTLSAVTVWSAGLSCSISPSILLRKSSITPAWTPSAGSISLNSCNSFFNAIALLRTIVTASVLSARLESVLANITFRSMIEEERAACASCSGIGLSMPVKSKPPTFPNISTAESAENLSIHFVVAAAILWASITC